VLEADRALEPPVSWRAPRSPGRVLRSSARLPPDLQRWDEVGACAAVPMIEASSRERSRPRPSSSTSGVPRAREKNLPRYRLLRAAVHVATDQLLRAGWAAAAGEPGQNPLERDLAHSRTSGGALEHGLTRAASALARGRRAPAISLRATSTCSGSAEQPYSQLTTGGACIFCFTVVPLSIFEASNAPNQERTRREDRGLSSNELRDNLATRSSGRQARRPA
jgi:hypothetical protein